MPYKPVLAVVIPVYNEANNLPALLRDWQPIFRSLAVPYTLILIDDGSKDNSLQLLQTLAADDKTLEIHTQPNAGHGPAILNGYRRTLDADWVFQIDSDHQLSTDAFHSLWANKEQYDLLLAQRLEANATPGRKYISTVSRLMVWLLFGKKLKDVNCPYRLVRANCLCQALEEVPKNSFAPNILLTAWFVSKKKRIFTTTTQNRKDVRLRQSKLSRHIFLGAWLSAFQTLLFRIKQ